MISTDTMLIFDLDGTLWDSATSVADSWNLLIRQEDASLPLLSVEDIHGIMGLTMTEISHVLLPGLSNSRRESFFQECSRFEVGYLRDHGGEVYPDLVPVLTFLRSSGYSLSIVSNCQSGYINAFLVSSGVASLFSDWEEWERTMKTKAENIRLIMERNHFDKAVYIGDTEKDQEAARLAGIPFIHAAYGFGIVKGADAVIRSLGDLPSVIETLSV